MSTDEFRELRPGDRVMVSPRTTPDAGPWLEEQAVFVAWQTDEASGIPVLIVCGLADGWDGQPNLPFGLRCIWTQSVVCRLREDQRIELLRRRIRNLARELVA